MKHFFLVALLIPVLSLSAQEEAGVQFTKESWKDILAEAKSQDKIVFVDAFTTWCGPCKMMDKNVFTDASVGEFYNSTFVNAKIDMEKGEGLEIARTYKVRAYPSFLFVNGDGELVHQGLGYQPVEQFIELGKIAMDDNRNIGGLGRRYEAGERSPELLRNYADALSSAMDEEKASEMASAYLETQKDWSTEENMQFVYNYAYPKTKAFDYIVKNREGFNEQFGRTATFNRLKMGVSRDLFNTRTMPSLEDVEAKVKESYPELADEFVASFKLNYFRFKRDMDGYMKAASDYISSFEPDDANELNSIAWTFYENAEDPTDIKKAISWAKESVRLDKGYANMDTLAALYFKAGKKDKGIEAAKEAIEIAKSEGMDYSDTQGLIDKYTK